MALFAFEVSVFGYRKMNLLGSHAVKIVRLPIFAIGEHMPELWLIIILGFVATDRPIDKLVYELCGLTEHQVKVLDGYPSPKIVPVKSRQLVAK